MVPATVAIRPSTTPSADLPRFDGDEGKPTVSEGGA
jgi:hypothetical protein